MRFIRFCGLVALALAVSSVRAADVAKAAGAGEGPAALSEEVRAQIGAAAEKPETLTAVMNGLDAAGQKAFLTAVNAAIAKAPGTPEQRAAMFLNANRAAIKCGSAKKNVADLLAVAFATVPPEALTVISERFADELFNRAADPSKTFTDAAYEKVAVETLKHIEAATAATEDAVVRDALAILMFLRASNGTPADLADRLVETIADKAIRETVKNEWIPAALAEGDKKSYDAMLAHAGAGRAPEIKAVMVFAGPQILDALLADVASDLLGKDGKLATPILDEAFGGFGEARVHTHDDSSGVGDRTNVGRARPLTQDPTKPWNPAYSRTQVREAKEEGRAYPYSDLGR